MEEAGGWNDRTTVEDMDLAVRAGLCGWKFVYIHDLEVKNELPSTFNAFRFQQHRWSCGPANLFRKCLPTIMANKVLASNPWKSFYFIGIRMHFPALTCVIPQFGAEADANDGPIGVQVIPLWKRLHMIYAFFFVRKIVAHIVTFTFYCLVIPASVLVPEVDLPFWGAVYVPSTITLLNAITTPK